MGSTHCLMTLERLHLHPLPVGIDGLERPALLVPSLRLLATRRPLPAAAHRMETSMKHLGTVRSFDETKGRGLIKPDSGGELLIFERSGIYSDRRVPPLEGQRLTYQIGTIGEQRCAVNLGNV